MYVHFDIDPDTTLFQVWTTSDMVKTIADQGFRLIASPSNYCKHLFLYCCII